VFASDRIWVRAAGFNIVMMVQVSETECEKFEMVVAISQRFVKLP